MMRPPLRPLSFLLAVLLAVPLLAQVPPFGASFPAANTRYGAINGLPLLRTNGHDALLFWAADKTLLVTKLVPGQQHTARPVIESPTSSFDAVWLGERFLIAATVQDPTYGTRIEGRIGDRYGNATGERFPLVYGGSEPHLAYNGTVVLMVYKRGGVSEALPLDASGRALGVPEQISATSARTPRVAAGRTQFLVTVPTDTGIDLITFDKNGRALQAKPLAGATGSPLGEAPLASDTGDRFLIAATVGNTPVSAYLVDSNGALIRSFTIMNQRTAATDVVWTGTKWLVMWADSNSVTLAELDSQATALSSTNSIPATTMGTVTYANGRAHVAWRAFNAIYASSPLPVPTPSEESSFAAASQQLLATAASSDATLAVWREVVDGRTSIRAGVRKRDGSWREREIASNNAFSIVAASNGQSFVVVDADTATFLSVDANPFRTVSLPFAPTAIAWNGINFLLYGSEQTITLSPAGTLGTLNVIMPSRSVYGCFSMASDGNGFFVTCAMRPEITYTGSPQAGVAGLRFDSAGQLIGTVVLSNVVAFITPGDVIWDGSQYFAGWRENVSDIVVARVGSSVSRQTIATDGRGYVTLARGTGGAFIGFSDSVLRNRLAFVRDDGQQTADAAIDHETVTPDLSRLHSLADGTLVRVFSAPATPAPHYGQGHVMMQIGTFALPPLPDAPALTVRRASSVASVDWTAPPQPVTGYRLEYAIDDGVWIAYEELLPASQRSVAFPLPWNDVTYSFRVRALNEAGAGAYSYPISLMPAKRRATR